MLLFGVFRQELLINFSPSSTSHRVPRATSTIGASRCKSSVVGVLCRRTAPCCLTSSDAGGLRCRWTCLPPLLLPPPPGGPALSRSIAFRRKRGLENMGRLRPPNSGGSAEPGSLRNIPVRDQPNPPRDGNEDPIPHSPRGIPLLGGRELLGNWVKTFHPRIFGDFGILMNSVI
jgi:hypothetical protein